MRSLLLAKRCLESELSTERSDFPFRFLVVFEIKKEEEEEVLRINGEEEEEEKTNPTNKTNERNVLEEKREGIFSTEEEEETKSKTRMEPNTDKCAAVAGRLSSDQIQ